MPVPTARRRRRLSPLTLRILAVNVLALAVLVSGLLYAGQYERDLVASELGVLRDQARLLALALGEEAITGGHPAQRPDIAQGLRAPDGPPVGGGGADAAPPNPGSDPASGQGPDQDAGQPGVPPPAATDQIQELRLAPEAVRRLIRRISNTTAARIRVFGVDGELVADSHRLFGASGMIEMEELPPPSRKSWVLRKIEEAYDWTMDRLVGPASYPRYVETSAQQAIQFHEVLEALAGDPGEAVRMTDDGEMILSVGEPIQYLRRVVGAVLLSQYGDLIEDTIRSVRLDILAISTIALIVTVLMSLYLAHSIARPIRRLAGAADRIGDGVGRQAEIPDLTGRHDEIGDLSAALREMTETLQKRLEAIERFAADVAHELKNPLTSLRSAVETASRINDPQRLHRLLDVVVDDVRRMDRLITDISASSRLDAELARAEVSAIDMGSLLATLVEIERMGAERNGVTLIFLPGPGDMVVEGDEDRLVQVFRNLVSNARSFSPPGGRITITVGRDGRMVEATIEDEGPGIPPGKEEAIFDRFYSERPEGEKFGTHSGLGLSISRQIVTAHAGTIFAGNRLGPNGEPIGARFTVRLPAAP